jgi:hypothetical protein
MDNDRPAWIITAILGLIAGIALTLLAQGFPASVTYSAGQRNYKIMLPDGKEQTLRADRIEYQSPSCILFYRQGRIDSILCEGLGRLFITEIIE